MKSNLNQQQPTDTLRVAARDHGMTDSEYDLLLGILGREPSMTELGIASVMWSEHCSYKSSKVWLKQLPTTAPWVICGPGDESVTAFGFVEGVQFVDNDTHNLFSYI